MGSSAKRSAQAPRWGHWLPKQWWTPREAAELLLEREPPYPHLIYPPAMTDDVRQLEGELTEAIGAGELGADGLAPHRTMPIGMKARPAAIARWAVGRGRDVPEPMRGLLDSDSDGAAPMSDATTIDEIDRSYLFELQQEGCRLSFADLQQAPPDERRLSIKQTRARLKRLAAAGLVDYNRQGAEITAKGRDRIK